MPMRPRVSCCRAPNSKWPRTSGIFSWLSIRGGWWDAVRCTSIRLRREKCSLAVDPAVKTKGIGRALVEALEEEGRAQELHSMFAFTYVPGFFGKLGFEEVDRGELPLKAWKDCLRCPKFQACDEIAVLKRLKPDAPPAPVARFTQVADFPQFPMVRKH